MKPLINGKLVLAESGDNKTFPALLEVVLLFKVALVVQFVIQQFTTISGWYNSTTKCLFCTAEDLPE